MKDHCHVSGAFRGAAQSTCNYKLRINPKMAPIPVALHKLRVYDAHHLMQVMSQQHKEVQCIANNMEKYIIKNYKIFIVEVHLAIKASLQALHLNPKKLAIKINLI